MKKPLHGLRGLMTLVIVLFHLFALKYPGGALIGHLWHGVDVFFVLSGFILSYVYARELPFNRDTFANFLVHRVARVAPICVISVVAYFAIEKAIVLYGFQRQNPLDTSLRNFIGNLLFLDSNLRGFMSTPAKWSLSNEIVAYLFLFPISYLLARSRRFMVAMLVTLAAAQTVLWADLDRMSLGLFTRCFPAFAAGCLVYHLNLKLSNAANILATLAGYAGFLLLPTKCQVLPATLIVLAATADTGVVARLYSVRPLQFLGTVSLSLYLLHEIYTMAALAVLRKIPGSLDAYNYWVWLPLAASLLTAALTYKFIERPARDGIKRLYAARRASRQLLTTA
ncbi:MAG: acyltransferase [Opitutaceae bacterium]|jgi:peptidoglycan/LPS O-acetylase OafA/YrhL|nr:acyltransferase [Opitutaceae bacterium]